MPRLAATDDDRRRARRLAELLQQHKGDRPVQDVASASTLRYETVRALLAGRSVGPSFFLVADLARVLDASLDDLADRTR